MKAEELANGCEGAALIAKNGFEFIRDRIRLDDFHQRSSGFFLLLMLAAIH